MTTETQTHYCAICFGGGETILIDKSFWICLDPKTCLDRGAVGLTFIPLDDATPEMYQETKAREAQTKRYWEDCIKRSEELKVVLGMDDTSFLTHMKLLNEMSAEDSEC